MPSNAFITLSAISMRSQRLSANSCFQLLSLEIVQSPPWKWQESIRRHLGDKVILSNKPYPTQEDIRTVSDFARSIPNRKSFEGSINWFPNGDRLSLVPFPRNQKLDRKRLASFFESEDWADGIPKPVVYKIANPTASNVGPYVIPLYTVAGFKGLEADGVILFIGPQSGPLDAQLYVGVSRARFLLHVVMTREIAARYKKLRL